MKIKSIISVLLSIITVFSVSVCAFAKTELSFRDGKFKILMLTDIQDDQNLSADMLNFVKLSIKESDPDIIVFTGDFVEDSRIGGLFVDSVPLQEGVVVEKHGEIDTEKTFSNIKASVIPVLNILQESGIPFAITQGNNDYKCGIVNKDWLELYAPYSNCIVNDESNDSEDRIDYSVIIKNSNGDSVFNLWMIDTGRHNVNSEQIAWYKAESDKLGKLPSLLFQHVQVDDIGNLFEYCSVFDEGSRIDNGKAVRLNKNIANGNYTYSYLPGSTTDEFTAWKEQGDVLGAFFGHQHVDGFSGIWQGIELGFTYGCQMEKPSPYGYRLITLHENDVKNYDNELYIYKSSVFSKDAHFEKQIDTPYSGKKSIVNLFTAIWEMMRSWLA